MGGRQTEPPVVENITYLYFFLSKTSNYTVLDPIPILKNCS